jgi:hypothetical protein
VWEPRTLIRMWSAEPTLESTAARAGCAMACPFSCSDEFEAAVIRSRLEAGVYGPKRRHRHLLLAGAASGMLVALLWMI